MILVKLMCGVHVFLVAQILHGSQLVVEMMAAKCLQDGSFLIVFLPSLLCLPVILAIYVASIKLYFELFSGLLFDDNHGIIIFQSNVLEIFGNLQCIEIIMTDESDPDNIHVLSVLNSLIESTIFKRNDMVVQNYTNY